MEQDMTCQTATQTSACPVACQCNGAGWGTRDQQTCQSHTTSDQSLSADRRRRTAVVDSRPDQAPNKLSHPPFHSNIVQWHLQGKQYNNDNDSKMTFCKLTHS